ncbi:Na+/H+ antiporter [Acetobacter okinawensis]|uniref:Na+/H+ antiporter n=1 Tax=Acetobacter okinawensis TaxID=1076594 RepID=UPI0015D8F39A|nr:Na+/H+ antiporter [Acetobacter okinawensis]
MHITSVVLLLLLVTAVSGPVARLLRVPLPLLLITCGVVASLLGLHIEFEPETFLLLFIPPLLFSDAYLMPLRDFGELRWPILLLAVGLVIFSTLVGGYFIHWLLPVVPLAAAFALAAILSPTDPVAVGGMIDADNVPRRFLHILHGEALLNDASGLVCFKFAVAAAVTGTFSVLNASLGFVLVSVGGIVVGIVLTFGFNFVNRILSRHGFDEPTTQITLMTLLPFAAYLLAEHMELSGILAAVSAGLSLNQSRVFGAAQTATRLRGSAVWEMITFVFNGLVFLLLGLQLPDIAKQGIYMANKAGDSTWSLVSTIVLLTGVLLLLRLVWIFLLGGGRELIAKARGHKSVPVPFMETAAMTIGGVRGAVTLAGILSLPIAHDGMPEFPMRDLLVTFAAGVIITSLLLAAVLLPALSRSLRHDGGDPVNREADEVRRLLALEAIAEMERQSALVTKQLDETAAQQRAEVTAALIAEYRFRLRLLEDTQDEKRQDEDTSSTHDMTHRETALARRRFEAALRLHLLRTERKALTRMRHEGLVSDETERLLTQDLDLEETVLSGSARALPRHLDYKGEPKLSSPLLYTG